MSFANVYFDGASTEIIGKLSDKINNILCINKVNVDFQHEEILFLSVLTGGSEHFAQKISGPFKTIILLAHGTDNSLAAALEILASLRKENKTIYLFNVEEAQDREELKFFLLAAKRLTELKGRKIGLIGERSPWLIASGVNLSLLKEKLGIEVKKYNWESIEFKSDSTEFINFFKGEYQATSELAQASQVHDAFSRQIQKEGLDALTVECFSLVKERGLTGCLSLALLNNNNIPAACEGDLVAAVGMLIGKHICKEIPWMCNIAKMDVVQGFLGLAHCTIAPNKTTSYAIDTHYETGIGMAIRGETSLKDVVVLRLSSDLNEYFLYQAKACSSPYDESSCRTQATFQVKPEILAKIKKMSLGNHQLVFSGDCRDLLEASLQMLGLVNLLD